MELLPVGMEKKKLNRSIWDFKCVYLGWYIILLLDTRENPQQKDSTLYY
jgi:hypothetical protein